MFAAVGLCACASPLTLGPHSRAQPAIVQVDVGISNVYIVAGDGPLVVVDAGGPGDDERVADALTEIGRSPGDVALIVLSHGHADHAGGAAGLRQRTGATIVSHPGDTEMLSNGRNRELQPQNLTASLLRPFVDVPYTPFEADLLLDKELSLAEYGIDGSIESLPGHTPGSLVILLDDGDALVGDLMAGGYLGGAISPDSPGGHYYHDDACAIRGTIERLLARGVQRFYLGHGGPVEAARVREAVEDGVFDCEEDP